MGNTAICIIARMASSRLPQKVMAKVEGLELISHIFNNMTESNVSGAQVVLCTTHLDEDELLVEVAEKHNIPFVRGPVESVADRMFEAAKLVNANTLVRVTGDNIFTDVVLNDFLIKKHLEGGHEYSRYFGLPNGVTTEVISLDTLKKCYETHNKNDSEYMTLHLNDPVRFDVLTVFPEAGLRASDINLSVDTPEDLERTKLLYKYGYKNNLSNIIKYIRDNGIESAKINENGILKLINKEVSYYKYKNYLKELADKSKTLKMKNGWYDTEFPKYFD